jgi:hypothetical protein
VWGWASQGSALFVLVWSRCCSSMRAQGGLGQQRTKKMILSLQQCDMEGVGEATLKGQQQSSPRKDEREMNKKHKLRATRVSYHVNGLDT